MARRRNCVPKLQVDDDWNPIHVSRVGNTNIKTLLQEWSASEKVMLMMFCQQVQSEAKNREHEEASSIPDALTNWKNVLVEYTRKPDTTFCHVIFCPFGSDKAINLGFSEKDKSIEAWKKPTKEAAYKNALQLINCEGFVSSLNEMKLDLISEVHRYSLSDSFKALGLNDFGLILFHEYCQDVLSTFLETEVNETTISIKPKVHTGEIIKHFEGSNNDITCKISFMPRRTCFRVTLAESSPHTTETSALVEASQKTVEFIRKLTIPRPQHMQTESKKSPLDDKLKDSASTSELAKENELKRFSDQIKSLSGNDKMQFERYFESAIRRYPEYKEQRGCRGIWICLNPRKAWGTVLPVFRLSRTAYTCFLCFTPKDEDGKTNSKTEIILGTGRPCGSQPLAKADACKATYQLLCNFNKHSERLIREGFDEAAYEVKSKEIMAQLESAWSKSRDNEISDMDADESDMDADDD